MQPKKKSEFAIISEPLKGKEAEESKRSLRELLDRMAVRARESGLTEEKVIELLRDVN